jgi:predicted O-methyltransferase YrrM
MKSRLTRNDFRLISAVYATLLLASVVAWELFGNAAILPFIATAVLVVLIAQFEGVRRTSEQLSDMRASAFDDYRQVESLLSLYATLSPDRPLPPMRDHSASPDLLRHAVSLMLSRKPATVLELGSGASTIVIAHCLKRLGSGRIISIDHDPRFAAITAGWIEEHGLQNFAKVLHAPLVPARIEGAEYLWYSIGDLDLESPIDFLVIDGPPYHVHPLARYPAVPLLVDRLSADACVLLDDANRPEEIRIAKLWQSEFPELGFTRLEAEKGALLITRSGSGSSDRAARELGQDKSAAHAGARIEHR